MAGKRDWQRRDRAGKGRSITPMGAAGVRPITSRAHIRMATVNDQLPTGEDPALLTDPTFHDPRRRDFLNIAAVTFAGAGAVAIVFPLVQQMAPSADVLADSSTDIAGDGARHIQCTARGHRHARYKCRLSSGRL